MVKNFEDLFTWQKARVLASKIYEISSSGRFTKDFKLSSQIQSAAVSIMSNIAEGFERGKLKEFYYFLGVAKASCGEVRSQLYVALDIQYIEESVFAQLKSDAQEISKMIGGLRSSVLKKIENQNRKKMVRN